MSNVPGSKKKNQEGCFFLLGAGLAWPPFVGSLMLYYFWKPQAFTNYGRTLSRSYRWPA